MEAIGFASALAGLAGQLIQVSRECTNILGEMQDIGNTHNSLAHELRGAGLRLKDWEVAWGLNTPASGPPSQAQGLNPSDDRHRHAVQCLAMILATFKNIIELQSKYKSETKNFSVPEDRGKEKWYKRSRLLQLPTSRSRSKSPSKRTSIISNNTGNAGVNPIDISLLEHPEILSKPPQYLQDEISRLSIAAQSIQNCLPEYRKFRWALTDKGKADSLVSQLRRYLDDLFTVMPPFTTATVLQSNTAHIPIDINSVNIPIALPYVPRHASFVHRKELLAQLEQEIEKETANPIQVAIFGTGGMGKTHLALHYISSHHTEYSSAFFVNAASEQTTRLAFTRIMQQLIEAYAESDNNSKLDYAEIGRQLGMAGRIDRATGAFETTVPAEEQHIIDAVKQWFMKKGNTKWLLLLDNVDDLESFDITDYIPASLYGGTVLITSRRPEIAEGRRGINVQQMDNGEAEQLLRKCAKYENETLSPTDQEALMTILQKLGNLPLALEQVGAYINRRQYSFTRYLKEFEDSITHVLNSKDKRLSGRQNRSVFASWELSFDAVQKENPKAADLLLLCGYLDNDDIPEELLRKGLKLAEKDMSLAESIGCLLSYSFIKRKNRDDSFSLHPLVHQWARYRQEPEVGAAKSLEAFCMVTSAITSASEDWEAETWEFERRIMPHLAVTERSINLETISPENEELRKGVKAMASVFSKQEKFKQAHKLYEWALDAEERILGPNHVDTLNTVFSMALGFHNQGQYNTALQWFKRALAGRENVLGPDHPDTLETVNNVALLISRAQGQYTTALEWLKRALAGREKFLGPDHPDTLETVSNIASNYRAHGQYDTALQWYKRALAGREKCLGPDHPRTLSTVFNIAFLFNSQGQYNTALEWYERALAGWEKSLGPDHSKTLSTISHMGSVYMDQGQYDTALEWYERALAGQEKRLGPDHPDTLITIHDMASVYNSQGRYNTALKWYQRALAGEERALGPDHPDTLTAITNIASLFKSQGQYNTALEWYGRALAGQEKSLGPNHADTLYTIQNMASVYMDQGQYDTALEWSQRALAGQEKSLGPDHKCTLTAMTNIASLFKSQGQYNTALEWYERALAGQDKCLGPDHADTLYTIQNMASVYMDQGQYDTALEWYQRALAGREKSLGPNHTCTLTSMGSMALVLELQQKFAEACQYWERVLDRQHHSIGDTHPHTQCTLGALTQLYTDTNQHEKARSLQSRLLPSPES